MKKFFPIVLLGSMLTLFGCSSSETTIPKNNQSSTAKSQKTSGNVSKKIPNDGSSSSGNTMESSAALPGGPFVPGSTGQQGISPDESEKKSVSKFKLDLSNIKALKELKIDNLSKSSWVYFPPQKKSEILRIDVLVLKTSSSYSNVINSRIAKEGFNTSPGFTIQAEDQCFKLNFDNKQCRIKIYSVPTKVGIEHTKAVNIQRLHNVNSSIVPGQKHPLLNIYSVIRPDQGAMFKWNDRNGQTGWATANESSSPSMELDLSRHCKSKEDKCENWLNIVSVGVDPITFDSFPEFITTGFSKTVDSCSTKILTTSTQSHDCRVAYQIPFENDGLTEATQSIEFSDKISPGKVDLKLRSNIVKNDK